MFEGFATATVDTAGAAIRAVHGGSGAPLLLLHGYPQTHAMWHRIAPALAENFTVVATDLRGYGDSAKPPGGADHAAYAKRAMAADQVEVMAKLGFDRFAVVGHDRGGRVAHRMALDHGELVSRLALLDIVPTYKIYAETDRAIATDYYHWFFLIQPYDLPERLIGADPEYYLRSKMGKFSFGDDVFAPEAMAEYLRCFRDPATIHASCEDYRAAAGIDLAHDEADPGPTFMIPCPIGSLFPLPRQEAARGRCGDIVKRRRRPEGAGKATLRAALRAPRRRCPALVMDPHHGAPGAWPDERARPSYGVRNHESGS